MSESEQASQADSGGLDPAQITYLQQRLRSEQRLGLGTAAGGAASLLGAAAPGS